MEYLPRTYSVLSVAAVEKFHTSLRELLPGGRYAPVQFAYDAADARRRLLENRYDIIIISAPLRDEFGTHLAQHFAEQSGAGILLLVKPEYLLRRVRAGHALRRADASEADVAADDAAMHGTPVRHAGAPAAHGTEKSFHGR